jgi:hypothetical protein
MKNKCLFYIWIIICGFQHVRNRMSAKPRNHPYLCFKLFICWSRITLRKIKPTRPAYREEEIPLTGCWQVVPPERPERGGPCWLVKPRRIGSQRAEMKGGPSLVGCWFDGLVVLVQETFIISWMIWSVYYKILFSSRHTISIYVSPSPSSLARQSCRAAYLWMCVSGCNTRTSFLTPPSHLYVVPTCWHLR